MSWKTFIESHFGCIAAIDTFTVEVLTFAGLVHYHALFVIDIATRRVEIAGITNSACGSWAEQIARNLTDEFDGFLRDSRSLIPVLRKAQNPTNARKRYPFGSLRRRE